MRRMFRIRIISLVMLLAFTMAACKKEKEHVDTPSVPVTPDQPVNPQEPVKQTFYITYISDREGVTGKVPAPTSFLEGNEATVSDNTGGLSLSDFRFVGWNTKQDGSGDTYRPGDKYSLKKNIELYAIWVELDKFAVSFNLNGIAPVGDIPETVIRSIGSKAEVVMPEAPQNPEHTFRGWYSLDGEGDTLRYVCGEKYEFESDIVIFAKWVPFEVIVTYINMVDGEKVGEVSETVHTRNIVLKGSDVFSRQHYEIKSWSLDADGENTLPLNSAQFMESDFCVYANWQITEALVSIDLNSGAGAIPAPKYYKVGEAVPSEIPLSIFVDATYSDGEIIGWSTDKDATEPDRVPYTIEVSNDAQTTLYAVWKKISVKYVDLGLPSGTLWATENLEGYYAWGETDAKESFSLDNYKHVSDGKYTDYTHAPSVLGSADDAAYQAIGKQWHIPTKVEFAELIANCSVSSTLGSVVLTSKINGKKLTLPKGNYWSASLGSNEISLSKEYIESPSATIEKEKGGVFVHAFSTESCELFDEYERWRGFKIRPVRYKGFVSIEDMEEDDL